MHDSWHGPNAQPDKRTGAQRHAVRAWTTCARARAHGGALLGPTHLRVNEQARPCVHFDDYCMPPSWHERACVRALPGWEEGLTARHSVDSVRRRHKVTGAERTSGAASASGASNLRQGKQSGAVCTRRAGDPCGWVLQRALRKLYWNCTQLVTYHTTLPLDGMHAITRNAGHAPCGMRYTRSTSDAQTPS